MFLFVLVDTRDRTDNETNAKLAPFY